MASLENIQPIPIKIKIDGEEAEEIIKKLQGQADKLKHTVSDIMVMLNEIKNNSINEGD